MSDHDPTGTDWTQSEIDLIVADYFDMLALELARKPYVKSHRNAALQQLTGRSHGSIEFKHQNISAVLVKLGMQWIPGYKPMPNFQKALIDGIEGYLDRAGDALSSSGASESPAFAEAPMLFFEPPPVLSTFALPELSTLQRLVRKFDPAARDARNRVLGRQGEERTFYSERARLTASGRADLARKVRWVSEEDGDGAGFDIHSFSESGRDRLVEVKTTVGHQTTPFYVSENERSLSVERPEAFRLVRLYDFAREPRGFELIPPLEESVMLRPVNYRASFDS